MFQTQSRDVRQTMPHASKPAQPWDFRRNAATARVLTQLGSDHGLGLESMLRQTGISRSLLDDPQGQIEAHQELQLIRNLQNDLPHLPTLGLQAGTRYHINTYGLWGFALMSSPTVGGAVSMGSRMLNHTFSLTVHEVAQQGETVTSRFRSEHLPPDVRQFVLDRDRAAVITLQREVMGRPLHYRAIQMCRPEPAPEVIEAYTELFGVRPLFDQTEDGAVVDATVLHEPLSVCNGHSAQLCAQMCRQLVDARKPREGVSAEVRAMLLRTPGRIPDMEEIAAEMGVTSRTLRRHLTAECASFRALLEEVRSTLAEALMVTASLTHGEIAERLGYADVTTFIEAFRRWRGMPPSAFRRAQGVPPEAVSAARRRFVLR